MTMMMKAGKKMMMRATLLVVAVLGWCGVAAGADCAAYLRFYGPLDGRVELRAEADMRHYDDYGRYLGKTEVEDGGERRFYDDYGRYLGKSETDGRRTRFYDDYGRYLGQMEAESRGRIRYADDYGRMLGYAEHESRGEIRYYDAMGRLRGKSVREGARCASTMITGATSAILNRAEMGRARHVRGCARANAGTYPCTLLGAGEGAAG